jgi:AraC-like DNA-binding protein
MHYDYALIHMTSTLESSDSMYSIICLKASRLSVTLNGVRCYLDGKYMLCLSQDDTLRVEGGQYETLNLHFQPYFYNVNLNHNVIGLSMYEEMRSRFGYPDFHLFRQRDASFVGILPLNDEEYELANRHFLRAGQHIDNHPTDKMWSCHARSDMISILRIAEGAYQGDAVHDGNEILRFIRDHLGEEITLTTLSQRFHTNRTTLTRLIKEQTGMTPMQYVMEERLNQSRPDLLFTDVSVQDLAEKYGFADVNYFIRAFKKRFGKTPLQYRTEGCAERIRNQNIYRRKERDMMKVADFENYLKKGLGRGLTLLRKEPDKTPYRQTVLDYYTKNEHFMRSLGDAYDAEMIRCFPDADVLLAEITAHALDRLKTGKGNNMISLLVGLGHKDTATAIVEQM